MRRPAIFPGAACEKGARDSGGGPYSNRPLAAAAFDPAAAQRSIEIDEAGQALQTRGDERLLGAVEAGLRGEDVEIAVDTVPIAKLRELQAALLRGRVALLRGELLVVGAARGEPVGGFAKGGLDRFFVRRGADVLADRRGIEVGPQRAAFED